MTMWLGGTLSALYSLKMKLKVRFTCQGIRQCQSYPPAWPGRCQGYPSVSLSATWLHGRNIIVQAVVWTWSSTCSAAPSVGSKWAQGVASVYAGCLSLFTGSSLSACWYAFWGILLLCLSDCRGSQAGRVLSVTLLAACAARSVVCSSWCSGPVFRSLGWGCSWPWEVQRSLGMCCRVVSSGLQDSGWWCFWLKDRWFSLGMHLWTVYALVEGSPSGRWCLGHRMCVFTVECAFRWSGHWLQLILVSKCWCYCSATCSVISLGEQS